MVVVLFALALWFAVSLVVAPLLAAVLRLASLPVPAYLPRHPRLVVVPLRVHRSTH